MSSGGDERRGPSAGTDLSDQVLDWAKDVNRALNGAASTVGLAEKVEKSPYALVGAALGVGYVLGGGLFTATTARLLRMGFKLAKVPVVQDKILEVAEAALDGLLANTKKHEPK